MRGGRRFINVVGDSVANVVKTSVDSVVKYKNNFYCSDFRRLVMMIAPAATFVCLSRLGYIKFNTGYERRYLESFVILSILATSFISNGAGSNNRELPSLLNFTIMGSCILTIDFCLMDAAYAGLRVSVMKQDFAMPKSLNYIPIVSMLIIEIANKNSAIRGGDPRGYAACRDGSLAGSIGGSKAISALVECLKASMIHLMANTVVSDMKLRLGLNALGLFTSFCVFAQTSVGVDTKKFSSTGLQAMVIGGMALVSSEIVFSSLNIKNIHIAKVLCDSVISGITAYVVSNSIDR